MNLEKIDILIKMNILVCGRGILPTFYLHFKNFFSAMFYSFQCTSLIYLYIYTYFIILDAIVNRIPFKMLCSDCSLLLHKNTIGSV